jgi:lipopolysaccharide export system permease protein
MTLISKIFIKQWFKALLVSLLVLVLLIVIGDIVDGLLRTKSGFSEIIFNMLTKLPELLSKILPISTLLASLFAFNNLKTHSELTAIFSSGYSYNKVYTLIFLSSLSVAIFQFYNVSFLQPKANEAILLKEQGQKKKISTTSLKSGRVWFKTKKYFSSFSSFNSNTNELSDITLYLYEAGLLTKILQSNNAVFLKNTSWILKPIAVYNDLSKKDFSSLTSENQLIVDLFVNPDDFTNFESEATTLNFINLYQYISKLEKTGINTNHFSVLFFEKLSLSLICIIFALFPLSTIYNPNRRSSSFGKNVVFTLVFTITYWLLYSSSLTLGTSGKLPPSLATLILPFIFIVYIIFTYLSNRKL